MSSTSRSRTPVHLALPTSLPPTSLLTQAIVTYCSNIGSAMSSSQVSVVSRSTRPWIRSVQVGGVDARREERGVDPVEAVVGHDDRRQARRPSATRSGSGVERRHRRRTPAGSAGRRRPAACRWRSSRLRPTTPATTAPTPTAPGPDDERAARPVGHAAVARLRSHAGRGAIGRIAVAASAAGEIRAASRGPAGRPRPRRPPPRATIAGVASGIAERARKPITPKATNTAAATA